MIIYLEEGFLNDRFLEADKKVKYSGKCCIIANKKLGKQTKTTTNNQTPQDKIFTFCLLNAEQQYLVD